MGVVVTYLAVIFACGVVAWLIRLPPLIGFLAAGFALNLMGVPEIQGLSLMADIGVTLMLFAIGLRLNLRSLLGKEVWLTTGAHVVFTTLAGAGFLAALSLLGMTGPEPFRVLMVVALLLSFSSTIFVVKVLQDRGDEQAFYGNVSIGILIMQDIIAVAVLAVSRGEVPSLFTFGLIALIPLLAWATKRWYRLGHGELGILFGIAMALIPGYALFEWLGLSGSLGALIMGLVLAPHPGADQLAHSLFSVKELLLIGFFVSIGFAGIPTVQNIVVGLLLILFLPVQAVLYWFLFWLLGLRNRTAVLASLALSNYSEFALIIAGIGVAAGWLTSDWLMSLVIAVSAGFIISSIANPTSVFRASQFAERLPTRPPDKIHPEDRPIDVGDATAIVLGMGRVGVACYTQLTEVHGYRTLGVEHDPYRVKQLRDKGVNVVEGDATDYDFWSRLTREESVEIIVLAMPSQHANTSALAEIRETGNDRAVVAAVALYREDVETLDRLGIDVTVHMYAGAGKALADGAHEIRQDTPRSGG